MISVIMSSTIFQMNNHTFIGQRRVRKFVFTIKKYLAVTIELNNFKIQRNLVILSTFPLVHLNWVQFHKKNRNLKNYNVIL